MNFLYSLHNNVSFNCIIHNSKQSYHESNYGGKKIVEWPFYNFLNIYLNDSESIAQKLWVEWLAKEYYKYCSISKIKGGMLNGSIHKQAIEILNKDEQYYLNNPKKIDKKIILKSCELFVRNKFKLVESIKCDGFIYSNSNKIFANYKSNKYELFSGHHRLAILKLLNYKKIDQIWVYTMIYKIIKKL